MQSTMHLYPIDGAAHRVGKNETPWSYREANWRMVIVGVDPNPDNKEIIIEWAREYWEAIHPHSAGGAYTNMMMEEGRDRGWWRSSAITTRRTSSASTRTSSRNEGRDRGAGADPMRHLLMASCQ